MVKAIRRFAREDSGAAAIEYGLLVAVVSVSVIGAGEMMGDSVSSMFEAISNHLNSLLVLTP